MATLQKIRNNAGLLVSIVIGLALLAFILGDLLRSGNSIFAKNQNEVAEIAGESVPIQLYQGKIDETIENYKKQSGENSLDQATIERLRDQTWQQLIHEYVMEEQFEEVGVSVSGDELFDMVQGNNIDPQIKQIPIFQNQETGQFDRSLVIQFLKNKELDPSGQAQASWAAFEKALVQQKIEQKYNELVAKGLYVTSLEAKKEAVNKNKKIDFEYVMARYNTVSDSAISYTDADLKKYYNEHKEDFEQEASREINYITFPVTASEKDVEQTKKWVQDAKKDFEATNNAEQFINLNSDVPFAPTFMAQNELPAEISGLFDAEVGTVYGPYREDNAFKLAKVIEFANIPDSVKASHILVRPNQNLTIEAAHARIDSIKNELNKGTSFEELAIKHSEDGSAQNGGDLGWFTEGKMVKPFNDACFQGEKGDITAVESQFGVHLIKIVDQAKSSKKVKIGILARTIEPSSKTYQKEFAKASEFGGQNRTLEQFRDAATEKGLNIKVATLRKNDREVANIENSRQMVRWAFEAEEGKVYNDIFDFGDVFVIAALKTVNEEGIAPFEDARVEIEREVKKEKKAEYLKKQMAEAISGANTLQTVAEKMGVAVKEAKNANYSAYSIPGLGFEPKVQGAITVLEKGTLSSPIEGRNGVYVVQVNNMVEPGENLDVQTERQFLSRNLQSRVNFQVFNAIKEAANIEDNRSNFY